MKKILSRRDDIVTIFNTLTGEENSIKIDLSKEDKRFNKLVSGLKSNDLNLHEPLHRHILRMVYESDTEEIEFRIRVAKFFHRDILDTQEPYYVLLHYLRTMEDWKDEEVFMFPEEKEALKAIFLI